MRIDVGVAAKIGCKLSVEFFRLGKSATAWRLLGNRGLEVTFFFLLSAIELEENFIKKKKDLSSSNSNWKNVSQPRTSLPGPV